MGAELEVVSLFDFVRYAYAEVIPKKKWGQSVPAGAPAGAPIWMVQTTWQGGITPINGDTTGETERQFQRIGMAQEDGKVTPVVPFAITDLGILITTTSSGWQALGCLYGWKWIQKSCKTLAAIPTRQIESSLLTPNLNLCI